MHNFLNNNLKPNVCVNCPETDGYEVQNLISENESIKSKGFVAYSAIRPPINVDFVFICPIKVNYILIWTSAGTQKSTGIELQVKNSNSDFTAVSKTTTEAPGIVFYNKKHLFRENKSVPPDFFVRHSRSIHYNLLNSVEKLRVRIFRTLNSVPCIGRIEVWGAVSQVCSETTKLTIQKLINGRHENNAIPIKNVPNCSKQNGIELFNIPEEFIDPISCEMMCLPMTLPCGKTVDQSTLEKHQESEAKWGRSPSDPFTGQVFTLLRKPVLNTALKSRIDKFLLENADNEITFNIHRTVGRKTIEVCDKQSNNYKQSTVGTVEDSSDVSDNLDDIINKSIQKYNIIRFTETENKLAEENFCQMCKTKINLYSLSCTHFSCKNCLLKLSVIKCEICNIISPRSSVKKYHR